ncbi:RNA-dependent ATPase rok1 [Polyrhizophydium stewartii]|uniref:RNA helicase n=1 Tax=Polyrhizophydium stewartii TaxID=2732419 RepID=A0ABR4N556_9FUNG
MDLFRTLGAGAKFNKSKYSRDFEVFRNAKDQSPLPDPLSADVVPELNFFKDPTAETPKPSKTGDGDDAAGKATPKEFENAELEPLKTESDANAWRKQNNIKVYGTDVPFPFQSFSELCNRFSLRSYLRRNLLESDYVKPTPIQMQAMPIMLHGREVMACAPTGSGKTLAFLLPILHDLKGPTKEGFRALIITPTRELAQQIYRELKKLSVGKPFKTCVLTKATNATNAGVAATLKSFDILISTPLRLVTALKEDSIKLEKVRHLVLDEADKLLELGFLEQVDEIFAACTSETLQKSLFSATIPSGVEQLAKTVMKDPIRIVIGSKNGATETINQRLLFVGQEEGKLVAIRQLIQEGIRPPVLIFVQSIERAKELFHELVYDGINVDVIHSERTQAQRDAIVQNFRRGKIWVLIATELMARGIDFKGVNLVINYDFPQSVQSYVHRIGRTGRAGRAGEAVTYFTKEDAPYLKTIVNVMKESGCDVPDWMLQLKNPTKSMKKNLRQRPISRDQIKTVSEYDERKLKRKHEMVEASKRRKLKTAGQTAAAAHGDDDES